MYGIVMAVTNLKLCTEEIEPLVKRIGTCIPMKACQPASLMAFYLQKYMGCVYCATNKINGKQYIGKTIQTFKQRKRGHIHDMKKGSQVIFHRALRKYGTNNFKWTILFKDDEDKLLLKAEKHFIKKYNTLSPYGYNMTTGGETFIACETSRRKSRKSTNKMWANKEYRKKQLATWQDPIIRKQRIDACIKTHNDPKFIKRTSDDTKRQWKDPIQRKNKIDAIKIAMNRPEVKAKRKYIRARKVICIETGIVYLSLKDAGIAMHLQGANIWNVCKGNLKHTGGYHFRFYEDNKNEL
jgi:group I intron endonuclease